MGFRVLPRRWVVERTFARLGRWRRLGKDHETLPATPATRIDLAMVRPMAARPARSPLSRPPLSRSLGP